MTRQWGDDALVRRPHGGADQPDPTGPQPVLSEWCRFARLDPQHTCVRRDGRPLYRTNDTCHAEAAVHLRERAKWGGCDYCQRWGTLDPRPVRMLDGHVQRLCERCAEYGKPFGCCGGYRQHFPHCELAYRLNLHRDVFFAHIDRRTDGCWIWTGYLRPDGYGQLSRRIRAHRFSYELHHGPIPDGLHLDHLCKKRACVNPEHLEAVTQPENNRRSPNQYVDRTHCSNGHEYTPQNTLLTPKGARRCRACKNERARAAYAAEQAKVRRLRNGMLAAVPLLAFCEWLLGRLFPIGRVS